MEADTGDTSFFSRIEPAEPGLALVEIFSRHAPVIADQLDRRGALLFRGFGITGPRELDLLCRWLGSEACASQQETSPRTRVAGGVYTATDYPAMYEITFHNENSYQSVMPSKLLFYCAKPARTGGRTWLADCRRVLRSLPPEVRRPFEDCGYRLTRSYHPHFGLSWQRAFGCGSKAAVEEFACSHGILLDWKDGDALTTTQVRPSVGVHPRTGVASWINHIYFFHHSNLPVHAREALAPGEGGLYLANDTSYADGSSIEMDALMEIRRAYESSSLAIDWQGGDVLLVDNLSVAHGRGAYTGERELYFAQTDLVSWEQMLRPEACPGDGRMA